MFELKQLIKLIFVINSDVMHDQFEINSTLENLSNDSSVEGYIFENLNYSVEYYQIN